MPNNSIARTEGHRIQCTAGMNACYKAKEKGADVVKQWDSTLDGKTRDSHRRIDGEIRELDEKFSNGLMFPSDPSGRAEEVINCRCALLKRARWALNRPFTKWSEDAPVLIDDDGTTQFLKFDSAKDYQEFKKQYLKASESVADNVQKMNLQFFARKSEDYKTIFLPKDEYAKIMHELNTYMSEEQRNQKVVTKVIGDYAYTIENHGFNEYRVIGKQLIDNDVLDWWDE